MVDSLPLAQASREAAKQPAPLFRSPKRIDWGTNQTESEDTTAENDINAQNDVFTTPPSKQIRSGTPTPKGLATIPNGVDVPTSSRVYDVPMLLRLSGSLAGIGVFAKIKPEALAENLFQYIGASRPFPMGPRSRALSELSNPPRRNFGFQNTGYPAYPPRSYTLPPRQSLAPPEPLSMQQKEGFARFLKQHASPPHHRVTAGGRIVPTGPLSPPPMFDYESLTGLIRRREQKLSEINSADASNRVSAKLNVPSLASRGLKPTDDRTKMWHNLQVSDSRDFLPQRDNHGIIRGGNYPDSSIPAAPVSMSLIPVSTLEDGSTVSSCNGMYYRTYWNGIGTVVEPIPLNAGHISTGTQTESSLPFTSNPLELPGCEVPLQKVGTGAPLRDKTNQSQESSSQSHTQNLETRQAALNSKLHILDRHMALHHYEISHEERASFVNQRRALVEEMDKLRRMKEPPPQNLPILSNTVFPRRASTRASSLSTRKVSHTAGAPLMPAKPSTVKTNNDTPRKGLSPSAPPFIPSSMKVAMAKANCIDPSLDTSLHRKIRVPSSSSDLAHSGFAQKQQELEAQRLHGHEKSLDRDPIDPAMRIIHNSDVEYAAHLPNNGIGEGKRYCTTVSEFQEAVRQVRQQARLYGCAGGSSKDPAYDAEQDIWWAICDHDPIPLPRKTPNHVSHAQPWDWNNSFFNFRVSEHAPSGIKKSSSALGPSSKKATDNIRKPSGSQKPIHAFEDRLLPALERRASGTSSHYSTSISNTANIVSRSRTLSKEYREIQKAIEALSRRCDEIIGNAKEHGVIPPPNTPSKRFASDSAYHPLNSHGKTANASPSTQISRMDDDIVKADIQSSDEEATRGIVTASQSASIARNMKGLKPSTDLPKKDDRDRPFSSGPKTTTTGSVKTRQADMIPERGSSTSKDATADMSKTRAADDLPDLKATYKFVEDISVQDPSNVVEDISVQDASNEVINKPPQGKSRVTSKGDLFARAKSQISPQKAAKKAKELYNKSRSKSPANQKVLVIQTATPPEPRVHLPVHDKDHLKDKSASSDASKRTLAPGSSTTTFHSSEVKSITFTNPPNDRFLREMIKGLRSASARTSNALSPKHNKRPQIKVVMGDDDLDPSADKENAGVEAREVTSQTDAGKKVDPFEASEYPNILTAKAPSSLAASDYHARGFLPQYDGEGKAQATTLTQQHGVPAFHRQARVKLPLSSSYDDRPTPISGRSAYFDEPALARERHVSWVTTSNDTSEDALPASSPAQGIMQGKENLNKPTLRDQKACSPQRAGSPTIISSALATLIENSPTKSRMRQGTMTG